MTYLTIASVTLCLAEIVVLLVLTAIASTSN